MLETTIGIVSVATSATLLLWYVGQRIIKARRAHYREHRLRKAAEYAKAYAQATWDTRTSGPYIDEMTGETFEESIARRRFQSEEEKRVYCETFHAEMTLRVNAMADADAKESIYATTYGGRQTARPNFRHQDLREAYNTAYLASQARRRATLAPTLTARLRDSAMTATAIQQAGPLPEDAHEAGREAVFDAFRGTRISTARLDRIMRNLGAQESTDRDAESVGDPATAATADLASQLPRVAFTTGGFTGRPSNPELVAILSPGREERTIVDAVRALQPSSDPVQRARDRSRARSESARQRSPEPETLEAVYRWPESMPPDDESDLLTVEILIRPAGFSDADKVPWTVCGHVMTQGYTAPNLDQQTLRSMYEAAKATKAGESCTPVEPDRPPERRLRRRPDNV